VLDEVAEWQNRPLDLCYPLVFFDAIRVKVRDEGFVRNKAIYIALGVLPDGTKEVLGIWIEQTEGAKFWLRVVNELKTRGAQDILIAVVDGLKGFPEAINAVFPQTVVQPASSTSSAIRWILPRGRIAKASRRSDQRTFSFDDAATKLLYLVLNHAAAEWKRPPREWAEAKTQFAVMFNERFVNA
jgi:putative transposase